MNDIFKAAHSYQFKYIINKNNNNTSNNNSIEPTVGENLANSSACSSP